MEESSKAKPSKKVRENLFKPVVVVLCLLIKWFIPPAAFSKCNLIVYIINYACSCSISSIRWIFRRVNERVSEWMNEWKRNKSVQNIKLETSLNRLWGKEYEQNSRDGENEKNSYPWVRAETIFMWISLCECAVEMWFHAIRFWWHPWLLQHTYREKTERQVHAVL